MMTKEEFEATWAGLSLVACHASGCTNHRQQGREFCNEHTFGPDRPLPPYLVQMKLLCDEYRRENSEVLSLAEFSETDEAARREATWDGALPGSRKKRRDVV